MGTRSKILTTADSLVNGDRAKDYFGNRKIPFDRVLEYRGGGA